MKLEYVDIERKAKPEGKPYAVYSKLEYAPLLKFEGSEPVIVVRRLPNGLTDSRKGFTIEPLVILNDSDFTAIVTYSRIGLGSGSARYYIGTGLSTKEIRYPSLPDSFKERFASAILSFGFCETSRSARASYGILGTRTASRLIPDIRGTKAFKRYLRTASAREKAKEKRLKAERIEYEAGTYTGSGYPVGFKYLRLTESRFYSPRGDFWAGNVLKADSVPTNGNSNGIYSVKNPKAGFILDSYRNGYDSDRRKDVKNTLAVLELSGTIVESEYGYRSESARIIGILDSNGTFVPVTKPESESIREAKEKEAKKAEYRERIDALRRRISSEESEVYRLTNLLERI